MENKNWSEKTASGLRNAADELEQFALKYNLGRMEVASFYQRAKKNYRAYLNAVSNKLQHAKSLSAKAKESISLAIKRTMEKLEKEENANIGGSLLNGLRRLRRLLKINNADNEILNEIDAKIQKLKIKIKI